MTAPRAEKRGRLASYLIFAAFAAYILLESFESSYLIAIVALLILSIFFFSLSIRSNSEGLLSLSWLISGTSLVFAGLTARVAAPGYEGLTILVFLLLAAYEFSRFNQRIESVLANARIYDQNIQKNITVLTRNHLLTIAKIVSLGLALCLSFEYFSAGLIVIGYPPGAGIAIFASSSVFLLVAIISLRSK